MFKKPQDTQKIKNQTKTSWGKSAEWYDEYLKDNDTYQGKVILPNLLRVLDIKKGEKVLELGCGQGYFSQKIQKEGADVTGVDVSGELLQMAKYESAKDLDTKKINYITASADDLNMIKPNTFDMVLIVLALQNMQFPAKVLAEANRVLKSNGRVVVVLNHPTFRIPKNSDWGFDTKTNSQYRRVDRYLSEISFDIEMHPGRDSKKTKKEITKSYHRSLQFYFKAFAKNNFLVSHLEEWISHKNSQPGPRAVAEDTARKEIPLFMLIGAIKK